MHAMLCIYTTTQHPHTFSSTHTSRGQAAADGPVEARLADAWIWIEHTAQFDLTQPSYLSVTASLILEWQLVTVQHQWAQAALKAILCSRWVPRSTVSKSWPSLASPCAWAWSITLPSRWPNLGPKEEGGIWGQRPEANGGSGCSATLYIAVI